MKLQGLNDYYQKLALHFYLNVSQLPRLSSSLLHPK